MKSTLFVLLCGIAVAGCESKSTTSSVTTTSPPDAATVSTTSTVASTPATQPDNTAINTRDRAPDAQTAGMQGESKTDIDLTATIRRRVLDQKLSVNASNVKIITLNGKVTLRGPVKNQDEKDAIGHIANDAAGPDNVDNELEIQTNG